MEQLIETNPHHVKVVSVEEFMKKLDGAKPYLIKRVRMEIIEGEYKGEKLYAYEAAEGKAPKMELVARQKAWVAFSPPKSGAFDGPMVSKASAPMTDEQAAMVEKDMGYTKAQIGTMEASGIIPRNTPQPIIYNFLMTCREMGANPFMKHVYLMDSDTKHGKKYYHVVNVHFAQGRALKHGMSGEDATLFDGLELDDWIEKKGDVTVHNRPKTISKTVYRMMFGNERAFKATILWAEYIGNTPIHGSKPIRMMEKTAHMHALRDGFADILGGLYAPEEIELIRTGTPLAALADNGKELNHGLKALKQAETVDDLKELAERFEGLMDDDNFIYELNAAAKQFEAVPVEVEQGTLFE